MRTTPGNNNEITVDGDTAELERQSAQQSGFKLNVKADITIDDTFSTRIDFDAERSVIKKENGTYSLKPGITVISEF